MRQYHYYLFPLPSVKQQHRPIGQTDLEYRVLFPNGEHPSFALIQRPITALNIFSFTFHLWSMRYPVIIGMPLLSIPQTSTVTVMLMFWEQDCPKLHGGKTQILLRLGES